MQKKSWRKLLEKLLRSPLLREPIINAFHFLYYHSGNTWKKNTFLGQPIQQSPFDLQIYQEIIYSTKPGYILQTGIGSGGSLLYFAGLLDIMQAPAEAKVVGIDIDVSLAQQMIHHRRIIYLEGNSIDPAMSEKIKTLGLRGPGIVSLDSDHTKNHVLQEMHAYAGFVSIGSYLVVEDTNINGHPVHPFWGDGPHEAVLEFLRAEKRFVQADYLWQRHLFSHHQGGWLRRIA